MVHPPLRRAGTLLPPRLVTSQTLARGSSLLPRSLPPPTPLLRPSSPSVRHASRLLGFLRQANGTDVELLIDVVYLLCLVSSISLVALKGVSEIYKILQVALLSSRTLTLTRSRTRT